MAAVVVDTYHPAPYNHLAVDSLPKIADSAKRLEDSDGWSHIRNCIRDVFMKHGVNEEFCIMLLHRHYDIHQGEKLVDHGLVQSPWDVAAEQEKVQGGSVLPKSWRFFEGELTPFEFKFVPKREVDTTYKRPMFPTAFVTDLKQVLEETGLNDVLGIRLHEDYEESEVELMEITYGRSSIMMPREAVTDPAFTAAWSFLPRADEKESSGVTTRHAICVDRVTDEGVATRHAICVDRVLDEGVATRHAICVDRVADEGVTTRHAICVDRVLDEGVVTRHAICVDRVMDEGVATRHAICVDRIEN